MIFWYKTQKCETLLSPPINQCPSYFAMDGVCTCVQKYRFSNYIFGCEPCLDPNCLKCDASATTCELCDSLYFIKNGGCERYCHAACTVCTDRTPHKCSNCSQGYYLDGTSCVTTCSASTYPDPSTGKCLKCPSPCSTCTSSTFCTSCGNSTYLEPGNTGRCISNCPINFYGDKITGTCSKCDPACIRCVDSSNVNCSVCATDAYRVLPKMCFTSCPIGFYGDRGSSTCLACHSSCATCNGATSSNCLTCSAAGTYVSSGTCKPCDPSCKSCTGGGIFDCTECNSGSVFKDGVCVSTDCPKGSFPIAATGECFPCPSACRTCTSISVCTSCVDSKALYYSQCIDCNIVGYTFQGSKCTEICGDGFNMGENQCDDGNQNNEDGCNSNCKIEAGWRCSGGSAKSADTCVRLSNLIVTIEGNQFRTTPGVYLIFKANVTITGDWSDIIQVMNYRTKEIFTNFSVYSNGTFGVYFVDLTYYKNYLLQDKIQIVSLDSPYVKDVYGNVVAITSGTVQVDFTILTYNPFLWQDVVIPIFRIIMLVPIILHMIIGKQHVSWISLEALQNVALFCFFNVDYDDFLMTVFDITYALTLQWFPNPFRIIYYDNYVAGRKPPLKFQIYQFSTLFIHNSGGLMIVILLAAILGSIFKHLEIKMKTSFYAYLSRALSKNQLKKLGLSLFTPLTLGIMLQVAHTNFSGSTEYSSFVISIICGIVIIGAALFIYLQGLMEKSDKRIRKRKKEANDHHPDGFFEHFKSREKGITFSLFTLISKLIYAGSIIYLYKYPLGQQFLALISRVITVWSAWSLKPFDRKKDTIYFFLLEMFAFVILILLMLERINQEGYQIYYTFTGAASAFIIIMILLISAYTVYMLFKDRANLGYIVNQKLSTAQIRDGKMTRKLKVLHRENIAE